jgi:hypothetical protein
MTSGPKPGAGALSANGRGLRCTYDAWNRLAKVQEWTWNDADSDGVFDEGDENVTGTLAEYR